MRALDPAELRALLEELAAELHAAGTTARIFVVGGAAIALAGLREVFGDLS